MPAPLRRGDPGYRRAVVGLVAAGLATFSAMYSTQALMPALSEDLHANPCLLYTSRCV